MSDVKKCPTCGAIAKYKLNNNQETFVAIQDDEALKKIGQLKKAMEKFKAKAEELEIELLKLKKEISS